MNLTRFHGVFAPNSHLRAQVTSGKRGHRTIEEADSTTAAGHAAMTWAQRLKRVFKIDIETCDHGGGAVKILACIEDPVLIQKFLEHVKEKRECQDAIRLPASRCPPPTSLFE